MNQRERIQVGEKLLAMSHLYGRELQKAALTLMLDAIADLNANEVLSVLDNWLKTSALQRIPLPADIRQAIQPKADAKDVGRDVAMKIRGAVAKFGWPNGKAAREHIGELGWAVVQDMGGWSFICENLGRSLSEGTFIAQCRDAAETKHKLGKITTGEVYQQLESSKAKEIINKINDKTKLIEE